MAGYAKKLRGALSTVFSEYAVEVQEAAAHAEERLNELEDRDRRREEREERRREEIADKYEALEG